MAFENADTGVDVTLPIKKSGTATGVAAVAIDANWDRIASKIVNLESIAAIVNQNAASTFVGADVLALVNGGAVKKATLALLGQYLTGIYHAKRDFAVKGDGQRKSTASITSGQATLTVTGAGFTSGDVGKPILVVGAGITTGNNFYDHCTTISAVTNSTTVTLAATAGTTVSNADVYWGTDDTAAIQTAIDAVSALGGTLYFPSSIYMVGGAIQSTHSATGYSAQICLPFVDQSATPVPFQMVGDPTPGPYLQFNGCKPTIKATVFVSTLNVANATGDAFPAIFGSTTSYGVGSLAFSQCAFVAKNIVIRRPHNSGLAGLDLATTATCELENIFVDTTPPTFYILQPTQISIGIRTPWYNNEGKVLLRGCFVEGCYFGMDLQEHASADDPWVQSCIVGLRFRSGYHYVEVRHAVIVANQYQINFSPVTGVAVTPVNITATFEAETTNSTSYPAWMRQTATVHDPSAYGKGRMLYHMVEGGVGINQSVFVNNQPGGTKFTCTPVIPP